MRIPKVLLTREEAFVARRVAKLKDEFYGKVATDRFNKDADPKKTMIDAIGAEIAVAKYLNAYWKPSWIPTKNVEEDLIFESWTVDVKNCSNMVWIQEHTPEFDVVIATSGTLPRYLIRGWIHEAGARHPAFYKAPDERGNGAWVVPFHRLIPIDDLIVAASVNRKE